MHCTKCGRTLESSDKFCTKCGTRVEERPHIVVSGVSNENWWYRLLKVAYIIAFGICIGGGLIIAYSAMPQKWVESSSSTIICDNGKVYELGKNSLYAFGDKLDMGTDKDARILCEYDTLNFYAYSKVLIGKNYKFVPHYGDVDYWSWFWQSLMSLGVAWVILKLIRIGVQYIVFGNRPKWKRELKRWY